MTRDGICRKCGRGFGIRGWAGLCGDCYDTRWTAHVHYALRILSNLALALWERIGSKLIAHFPHDGWWGEWNERCQCFTSLAGLTFRAGSYAEAENVFGHRRPPSGVKKPSDCMRLIRRMSPTIHWRPAIEFLNGRGPRWHDPTIIARCELMDQNRASCACPH